MNSRVLQTVSAGTNGAKPRSSNRGQQYSLIENSFQFQNLDVQGSLAPSGRTRREGYCVVTGIIARSARTSPSSVTAVRRSGRRRLSSLIQPRS